MDFSLVTTIDLNSFMNCTNLTSVILRNTTMVTLTNANAFDNTPIAKGTGYIYVPKALLSDTDSTSDYRQAASWISYSAKFRAIEDYPEICGGGE